jgi:hypothetical protein
MSFVLDYPMQTTPSGLDRDGGGNSVPLVIDSAEYPYIAFSAGLPGRIWLSELPGLRNVRDAMAAHNADGWKEAMNKEMASLKSHDIYELVPRVRGLRTLKLGWVLHQKFKNGVFNKNKARLVARGNQQCPSINYNKNFLPVMCLESLRTILALATICGKSKLR